MATPLKPLTWVIPCVWTIGCANAAPAPRSECSSPEASSAYQSAESFAKSLDDTSADASGAPSIDSDEPEAASCALSGMREGLAKRRRGCHEHDHGKGGACEKEGKLAGQVAANLYCDLSVALGGIGVDALLPAGEVDKCSDGFEAKCHERFDAVARARPDCAPFLGGTFAAAYGVARFNQCLFTVGTAPANEDCSAGGCECRDQRSCEAGCSGDGCEVSCKNAGSCETSCGDDCKLSCKDTHSCRAETGDAADVSCTRTGRCDLTSIGGNVLCREVGQCEASIFGSGSFTCERASSCKVTCADCDVSCRDSRSCEARIEVGRVQCERTGSCRVQCEDGRRPLRCGKNVFVCGDHCS